MSAKHKLKVVICWHMHQPQYRDIIGNNYRQPWTYLHSIKDYVDMAAHLEAAPNAKAVVNFSPILLDQITDYAKQVDGYLENSISIRDPLLAALVDPVLPEGAEQRCALMKMCLRANKQRLIDRFSQYNNLAEFAQLFDTNVCVMDYIRDQFLVDLMVWYHLAWLGETVRRKDKRIQHLIDKGKDFTLHDRRILLEVIGELLSTVIDRYKALSDKGQIELSVSPYAHPIMPLLLDIECAREAMPDAILPVTSIYPGGEERVRWHLQEAINCFEKYFGKRPAGCWPSEGGVSDTTLNLLEEFDFRWAASGETVLRNSRGHHDAKEVEEEKKAEADETPQHSLYKPYHVNGSNVACFFRDDRLSDQIGFVYADWHADDAVANLIHHLENIAEAFDKQPNSVVSLILDGENAWEYYPENGYYFLSTLYQRLSEHAQLELTTFTDYLDQTASMERVDHIVSGSWVHGTFSTWIGEKDKNRGWEMLCDAKAAFDKVMAKGFPAERRAAAEQQLAICEGSDWFWWFGEDNPASTVSIFDQLFRLHLSHLYQLLHLESPEYLAHTFTHGGGTPLHGGTMRPGQSLE